jgi:hypothetical protein
MRRFLLTLALGWACSGIGLAQAPDTLFISTSQVVHLRFASELKYVNLGSRDIVAKIVDGSKVFAAVKAREAFGECTSMSCLEARVCGAVRLRRRLAGVEVSSADGTEMGLPAGLSSPLERQSVLGFR